MRKIIFIALALCATAILAACSTGGASGLTGKNWQLSAITEKLPAFQGAIPPAEQAKYTITFNADGTFSGAADCNQIAGTFKTLGSNGITITPGTSTMAICGEGSLDLLYVHSLGKAKTYAIANEQLTLTLSDEGTLAFMVAPAASPIASTAATTAPAASTVPTTKPTPKPTSKPTAAPTAKPGTTPAASAVPAPVTGLIGKVWQLTAITEKTPPFQGAVPAAQQPNYTAEFKTDGTFSAKADCNTVSGTYVTADASAASGDLAIAIGPSTTVACPDGSYADLYLIGLSNAASYVVANNQLTITLTDEGTLGFK